MKLHNFKVFDNGKIRIYDHSVSTQQLTKTLALNDVEVMGIGKESRNVGGLLFEIDRGGNDHV